MRPSRRLATGGVGSLVRLHVPHPGRVRPARAPAGPVSGPTAPLRVDGDSAVTRSDENHAPPALANDALGKMGKAWDSSSGMSRPDAPATLKVPPAAAAHYARNFIRLAVCELRFPTLFELEADRPPVGFSRAIRREYPSHELLKNLNVNAAGLARATAHSFRSKKGRWTVTLRASALSLETSNYDAFEEFQSRLDLVLNAARETIDSDFFTRVGLRYINTVPFSADGIAQWVNPALVAPLDDGTYGDVEEHWQRTRGPTAVGGYSFQHGISKEEKAGAREYLLDFDFYREDVPVSDAIKVVQQLHQLEFSMFTWTLGPEAKKYLGRSTLSDG